MVQVAVLLLVVGTAKLVRIATAKSITRIVRVSLLAAEVSLTGVVRVASEVVSVAGVVSKVVRSATEVTAAESVGKIQS